MTSLRFTPVALLFALVACSQAPVLPDVQTQRTPPTEYKTLFSSRTRHADQYTGLFQLFQADVTILSRDLIDAQVALRTAALKLSSEQAASERDQRLADLERAAAFYVRFYSPNVENDDLDRPKSVWRTYLTVNGRRLEGRVKKIRDKLVTLQTLYPNLDRFSSPYEVSFDVSLSQVERGGATFTLTGNLGTAEFTFPADK